MQITFIYVLLYLLMCNTNLIVCFTYNHYNDDSLFKIADYDKAILILKYHNILQVLYTVQLFVTFDFDFVSFRKDIFNLFTLS